ncbi:hypothetical protein AbraIFM66951_002000 [Aspergillus brasiliensis]|nr:hypothetical protein AbraIFM66951_002000 [Aspergillus brasiliensis]
MAVFQRLVRFAIGDQIHYGELLSTANEKYCVQRYEGNPFDGLQPTDEQHEVETTPIIICIGLNYHAHAQESKLPVPLYPPVFTKPADALAGPFETIQIHPDAQPQLDYEGELTVIIGQDAKNVPEEQALDYILGYTAGNDLSARNFQLPAASGGQFCYAKSFDQFAPVGQVIVSASRVGDPQALNLVTRVNGIVKQETSTGDMIWGVRQIIAHLSRGTTLRKGTVIMTGTPAGVGFFRHEFLQDGDVVEVEVEGVGLVRNRIAYL